MWEKQFLLSIYMFIHDNEFHSTSGLSYTTGPICLKALDNAIHQINCYPPDKC